MHTADLDSYAIALLCSQIPHSASPWSPLQAREYHALAVWLHRQQLRPADLLGAYTHTPDCPLAYERIQALLAREQALADDWSRWQGYGIWLLTRNQTEYPSKLRARLGASAPPIIYGIGPRTLPNAGGLAIVGSRDADQEALNFTALAGKRCANEQIVVISGGARGVDRTAVSAAIAEGGQANVVLADALLTAANTVYYQRAIAQQSLSILSPFHPQSAFSSAQAMYRNKIIYVLSDYALVVSSQYGHGGTWQGASENSRHAWVPLLVRTGDTIPLGNQKLLEGGAAALHSKTLSQGRLFRQTLDKLQTSTFNYDISANEYKQEHF
jgi:predicted Rossmann fold nucleotide-binding protein DprA/Smf involved in DNA uptake